MKGYKIWFTDEAKAHLRQISLYISDHLKAPQASINVTSDLKEAIFSLRSLPERIPLSRDERLKKCGIRCMVVRKYLIYFRLDESARQVIIRAVIYGRRDQTAQVENIIED